MGKLIQIIREFAARRADLFCFVVVGVISSAVHWCISWYVFYHVLVGMTTKATLAGYAGGWVCSYLGNRLWSFRRTALKTSVHGSALRFVVCQLVAAGVLLLSTNLIQQAILLYFHWYAITNNLALTPELARFCDGASYPPALFGGMVVAAACSYLMSKLYVFK